jgi:hypothetical protein
MDSQWWNLWRDTFCQTDLLLTIDLLILFYT